MIQATDKPSDAVRLDVWLWAARFFKTRGLAKAAIQTGKIEAGGLRAKPSRLVRVGDALRIVRGEEILQVTVAMLDVEDEASILLREQQRALRTAERGGYRAPEHKPDKRARRLIQALGDLDAW